MERTLWFCCSAALFSSPHLFKAVRQQSGTINLNWSALPAPLWLDVMISGCHSAHWYVSPRDPSASLYCHEQPGVYRGHAGGFLPRSIHSTQPPQSCVIIIPRLCLLCLLVASVTYGYHLHTVYGAMGVYFYEKVCLWKSILWITDESYNLLTFDRKVPINIQLDLVTHIEKEERGNVAMCQALMNRSPFHCMLDLKTQLSNALIIYDHI